MPPNLRAALGTGLQTCTPSASVPFGEEPPVQASLPTQSQAGPLSVSSLLSPPGLTGRPRGANTLESRSSSLKSRSSRLVRDMAFVLVANLGKGGSRPGFRPVCKDGMPPPSQCQSNSPRLCGQEGCWFGGLLIFNSDSGFGGGFRSCK